MLINEIMKAISYLQVIMLFVNPIEYNEEFLVINDHEQMVYTLSIDMNSENVEVSNALSFDMFYGFETTSDMAENGGAYAAVNGMFYDEYGYPLGILVKDGRIISTNKIGKPSVVIDYDGKVIIDDIDVNVKLIYNENEWDIAGVNKAVYEEEYVLFDSSYGKTTRVRRDSINYHINRNVITNISYTNQPVSLMEDEYILTVVTKDNNSVFDIGDEIGIEYEYTKGITNVKEAFQSGGWLVKDGENVSQDYELLMGNTNIPNPRTIIGVDRDNRMIIKVIDGRNDNSFGVTGDECAELMIDAGCVNAVYVDGGASSTMVVNDQVMNNPSAGYEREVAHSIIFKNAAIYLYNDTE